MGSRRRSAGRRPHASTSRGCSSNLARCLREARGAEAAQLALGVVDLEAGRPNMAEASAVKVMGTEFFVECYRLLLEIVGPAGSSPRASPAALRRHPRAGLPRAPPRSPSAAASTRSSATSSRWPACGLPRAQRRERADRAEMLETSRRLREAKLQDLKWRHVRPRDRDRPPAPDARQRVDDPALVRGHGRSQSRSTPTPTRRAKYGARRHRRSADHAAGLDAPRDRDGRSGGMRKNKQTAAPRRSLLSVRLHVGRRDQLRAGTTTATCVPATRSRATTVIESISDAEGDRARHRLLHQHPRRVPRPARRRGRVDAVPRAEVQAPPAGRAAAASGDSAAPAKPTPAAPAARPRQRLVVGRRRARRAPDPALQGVRGAPPSAAADVRHVPVDRMGQHRRDGWGHGLQLHGAAPPEVSRLRLPARRAR